MTVDPARRPPYSDLASPESEAQAAANAHVWEQIALASGSGVTEIARSRALIDEFFLRPGLERLRERFAVTIESREIGGVRTDVVRPVEGVAPKNADRVLINLHGGGLSVAARLGGQQESVPIASLGGIEVITVDYRQWPEHGFPAASEDVAAVYRALLDQYAPENIGIYGCSAGGYLTVAALAWFDGVGLPFPGAIGVFGSGAVIGPWGDALHIVAALQGREAVAPALNGYFGDLDTTDVLVSPGLHPELLERFPPSLILTGTRDLCLSVGVHLHAQLVKGRVDARLHVWEGAEHCSFAQGAIDPDAPETREAWDVIVRFFDERLGTDPLARMEN